MAKYIKLEELMRFPIRRNHYDKEHGSKDFIYGIETVLEYAENLQTTDVAQEWISVDDRLPEMGEHYQSEDVLVCIDYRPDDPGTTEDTYVSIDHVDFNCFEQGEFSCERDDPRGGEPSPYFVTHWMPLPQPPKGE